MDLDELDDATRNQTGLTLGVVSLRMLTPDVDEARARTLLTDIATGLDPCELRRVVRSQDRAATVDAILRILAYLPRREAQAERTRNALARAAIKLRNTDAANRELRAKVAALEAKLLGERDADAIRARLNRRRLPR